MTFHGEHPDELISASLSGDLTDAERAELEAHLQRCERCRATLAAFKAERRILSGLPAASPPRDLAARVRGGIESGRFGVPWWRRPIGLVAISASTVAVAAVVLALVVLNRQPPPVGQASGSPEPSLSGAPSANASGSIAPSVAPSRAPTFLAPGQLGYLELSGGSLEASKLTFINDATGASIAAGTVSGPPIAASLSPDGQWLAYLTQKGETGANEVWVANLVNGSRTLLGCSLAVPFADRLSWSPRSDLLAFTVVAANLGTASDCAVPVEAVGTTRVWLFSVADEAVAPLKEAGSDTFAAGFESFAVPDAANRLWVSHAGATPSSDLVKVSWPAAAEETLVRVDGMFLPMVAPDGNRVLFWRGTMSGQSGGGWTFAKGGMPYISGDRFAVVDASVWQGQQLFGDLVPYGGEAFAHGKFAWGPDSDLVAFWDGAWTGVPQSADGTYPNQQAVYVGRVSAGLLSRASRLPLAIDPSAWIVDVTFTPDGSAVIVTVGLPSAGIGDPPSAVLQIVSLDGNQQRTIGGGVNPPPWDGPAVYGR